MNKERIKVPEGIVRTEEQQVEFENMLMTQGRFNGKTLKTKTIGRTTYVWVKQVKQWLTIEEFDQLLAELEEHNNKVGK